MFVFAIHFTSFYVSLYRTPLREMNIKDDLEDHKSFSHAGKNESK